MGADTAVLRDADQREAMAALILQQLLEALSPRGRRALELAAIPHWFDGGTLGAMWGGAEDGSGADEACAALEEIRGLAMVQATAVTEAEGSECGEAVRYTLHESTRARLLAMWRGERVEALRQVSGRLQAYFEAAGRASDGEAPFGLRAEGGYHQLAAAPAEGMRRLREEMEAALEGWRLSQAEYWLQIADEQGWALGEDEQAWRELLRAKLVARGGDYREAERRLRELDGQGLQGVLGGQVRLELGSLVEKSGAHLEALRLLEEALALLEEDGRGRLDALGELCGVYWRLGNIEEGERRAEEGLEMARRMGDDGRAAGLINLLGWLAYDRGDTENATGRFEESLRLYEAIGNRWGTGDCLGNLAQIYSEQNRHDEAIEMMERALATAREAGDRSGEGVALGILGNVLRNAGLFDRAQEAFLQALKIDGEVGYRLDHGINLLNFGDLYYYQGQWERALGLYEQAMEIWGVAADARGQTVTLLAMGNVRWTQKKRGQALELYQQSLAMARQAEYGRGQGAALDAMGSVRQAQKKWEQALGLYEQSLEMTRQVGDKRGQGVTLHEMGNVRQAQKKWEEALRLYEQALELKRQVGDKRGQRVTLYEMGYVSEKRRAWGKAGETYEEALALAGDAKSKGLEALIWDRLFVVYFMQGRHWAALRAMGAYLRLRWGITVEAIRKVLRRWR